MNNGHRGNHLLALVKYEALKSRDSSKGRVLSDEYNLILSKAMLASN